MKKYYLATVHYDTNVAVPICSNTDKYKLLKIMNNMRVDDEYAELAIMPKKDLKRCNNNKEYVLAKIMYRDNKIIPMYKNTYIHCVKYVNDSISEISPYGDGYKIKVLSEKKLNKLLKEGYEIAEA